MIYRNDHAAALVQIEKLKRENNRLNEQVNSSCATDSVGRYRVIIRSLENELESEKNLSDKYFKTMQVFMFMNIVTIACIIYYYIVR